MSNYGSANIIKGKVSINLNKLAYKIKKMEKDLGIARIDVVNDAAGIFLQSVIKETPPNGRAKDTSDPTHRLVRNVGNRNWGFVRIYGEKPKKIVYGTLSSLQQKRDIWFRGIGKMGWMGCLKYIKTKNPIKIAKIKTGDKIALKQDAISSVKIGNNAQGKYMLTLTNKAQSISGIGIYAVNKALNKAYRRLSGWGKNYIKQKARQSWQVSK